MSIRKRRARTPAGRFWQKVRKTDGCWNWRAAQTRKGYGHMSFGGKVVESHRVSWMLNVGPIPSGLWVLHRCDNPLCVRPDHLFLGTAKDNIQDAWKKGRMKRPPYIYGEQCSWHQLKPAQVTEIRRRHSNGELNGDLAREFGVRHNVVWKVVNNRSWRYLL